MDVLIGIYKLRFSSGKFYIGRSTNILKRFKQHIKGLINSTHINYKLIKEYTAYGQPNLEVLELCSIDNIILREQFYIDTLWSDDILNISTTSEGFEGGDRHLMSKYSNNQVHSVLSQYLNNPEITNEEISSITGVSIVMVGNILKCKNHTWLKEKYSEEYTKLLEILPSNRNSNIPVGTIIKVFEYIISNPNTSLKYIADTFNVNYESVRHLSKGSNYKFLQQLFPDSYQKLLDLSGKRKTGRLLYNLYNRVKSPEGIVFDVVNRTSFAKEHGLNNTALGNVLNGKAKHHKGWVAVK